MQRASPRRRPRRRRSSTPSAPPKLERQRRLAGGLEGLDDRRQRPHRPDQLGARRLADRSGLAGRARPGRGGTAPRSQTRQPRLGPAGPVPDRGPLALATGRRAPRPPPPSCHGPRRHGAPPPARRHAPLAPGLDPSGLRPPRLGPAQRRAEVVAPPLLARPGPGPLRLAHAHRATPRRREPRLQRRRQPRRTTGLLLGRRGARLVEVGRRRQPLGARVERVAGQAAASRRRSAASRRPPAPRRRSRATSVQASATSASPGAAVTPHLRPAWRSAPVRRARSSTWASASGSPARPRASERARHPASCSPEKTSASAWSALVKASNGSRAMAAARAAHRRLEPLLREERLPGQPQPGRAVGGGGRGGQADQLRLAGAAAGQRQGAGRDGAAQPDRPEGRGPDRRARAWQRARAAMVRPMAARRRARARGVGSCRALAP